MPEIEEKANKTKALQVISKDYIQPENIRLIGRRIHVSATWLMSRFGLDPAAFANVLDEIGMEGMLIILEGKDWIDDQAFIHIYQSDALCHKFDEASIVTTLNLLGHYDFNPQPLVEA